MKKLNLLICAALLSIAVLAFAESSPSPSTSPESPSDSLARKYTCSMHPEVVQDKPGKCPKCGMNLEPKKEEPKQ